MNIKEIENQIKEAFGEVIAVIDNEFDEVISDEMAFTDLGFVGQDIIDTGRLLDSKTINSSDDLTTWEWNPHSPNNGFPYAGAVRSGFFAYGGNKFIPGREWDTRAIQRVDPVNLLAEKLSDRGFDVTVKSNSIF